MADATCADAECGNKPATRGLCAKHHRQGLADGTLPRERAATRAPCTVEGCGEISNAKGMCGVHYSRWREHGDPNWEPIQREICTIDGCGRPHAARGWCYRHWECWKVHGDPLWQPPTTEERFWSKVDKNGPVPERRPDLGQCWLWTDAPLHFGHGRFTLTHKKSVKAHRFAYELLIGPIPEALVIDHLCRNPPCVNPAHLEPVTKGVNALRGETFVAANKAKTHCKRGHRFDEENTIWVPAGRKCRACRILWRSPEWPAIKAREAAEAAEAA